MKFIIHKFQRNFACFYKTALFTAVEKENVEMVKVLLANNVDVNIIIIFQTFLIK